MFIPRRAHIGRYRQIASAAARHGLGFVVAETGLGWLVPFQWGIFGHPRRPFPYTRPEHLRMLLEELGTTFIKLGQVLSTRPDLLAPAYIVEFAKLRDQAPPVQAEAIVERIEAELARPLEEMFARFDRVPLASASIGQVHAAELRDGRSVVVKVQKPGVQRLVETDLEILLELANRARRRTDAMYDIGALVEEFSWTLRGELDYLVEGRNADLFRRNFADQEWVRVPQIHWEYTTSRVLTMDRIQGMPIEEAIAAPRPGMDSRQLATNLVRWVLKQMFEDGFFHADPHPGNFFLLDGDALGVVDFGMVGYIDEETQYNLLRLLQALAAADSPAVVDLMTQLGAVGAGRNIAALRREMHRVLGRYYGRELGEVRLTSMIDDLMTVVRRHQLHMPADLAVLLKTLMMHESLAERIDPHFRLADVVEPYSEEALSRMKTAEVWGRRLARGTLEAAALSAELPSSLRRIVMMAERGEFEVAIKHDEVGEALSSFNSMLRTLGAAVLVGSAVIAWATLRRGRDAGAEKQRRRE